MRAKRNPRAHRTSRPERHTGLLGDVFLGALQSIVPSRPSHDGEGVQLYFRIFIYLINT